jgi:hypothetical protein
MLVHEWQRALVGIGVLILSIPIGILIANASKDELKIGRRWFISLMIFSIMGIALFFLTKNIPLTLTFEFIFIISSISYWISYHKRKV